jgi:peroxiredoxin Q/BCP
MKKSIAIGDSCPCFCLPNQDGNIINLADYLGKSNIVLFFYPKDDTPGCTKEACTFRDEGERFVGLNCKVFGISSDPVQKHQQFAARYSLNYDILSDQQQNVRKLFGVPKNLFGLIPGRVTYIIDVQGTVQGIFNSLTNPVGHVREAIDCLERLSGATR